MRKLVFILLAFIAVATFIRAYDTASVPPQQLVIEAVPELQFLEQLPYQPGFGASPIHSE
jgi:hypothetical protein